MSEEKKHEASPQRLRQARERGQVPRSMELPSSLGLAAGVAVGALCLPWFLSHLKANFQYSLGHLDQPHDPAMALSAVLWQVAILVGPMAVATGLLGVATQITYSGLTASWTSVQPDLNRLNPIEGAKRLLSSKQLVEAARTLMKTTIFVYIGYKFLVVSVIPWIQLSQVSWTLFQSAMGSLLGKLVLAQVAIGVLDALYQRWEYARSLKMTDFEVKQEHKQSEGDPMLKAKIRQMQRKMAKARSTEGIKKAAVLITNPTHLAIALQYDETTLAPKIVAKGADHMAAWMRFLARRYGVPIVEDKPLARALYHVELEQMIPPEHYRVVAQILAKIAMADKYYAE